jgi:multidrug resistance efflux pump
MKNQPDFSVLVGHKIKNQPKIIPVYERITSRIQLSRLSRSFELGGRSPRFSDGLAGCRRPGAPSTHTLCGKRLALLYRVGCSAGRFNRLVGESMIRKILGYGLTLAVAVAGGWIVWGEYQHYTDDPWTRDGQVRANVVGIAPRVPGPIIRIAVIDNQQVKQGDLLFEIDPADYHAAVEQAKAQVLAAKAASTQRKQELDRQTALLQKKVNAPQEYQDAQDNYDSAQANLAAAKANLLTSELKLSYTKVYASVNGEVTNLDISEGAYASAGQQVMALVDRDSYWIAAYFKETQLRHISAGDTVIISLMGNEDLPFKGTVCSVGWGIFVTDGSSGQGTALLPSVSPTIDWVRLPQRFPVRIQVDSSAPTELRIGQTVSVAISHGSQSAALRL